MSFWVTDNKLRSVWMTIVFIIVILLNFMNVRRYGDIEYWMTVVKIETLVGLIVLGILLPMGASAGTRKLGTLNGHIVSCPTTSVPGIMCLESPGFACESSMFRIC